MAEIKDGDRNTKYFHHKAYQRRSMNYMSGLHDSSGVWITERNDLELVVTSFDEELFSLVNSLMEAINEALEGVYKLVSPETNPHGPLPNGPV